MTVRILTGDAREMLRTLPAESVHCCVTSPPYWAQRDYGVDGQLGREASLEEHVAVLVSVFREVRRVLRADGTVWLNYGDAWATKGYRAHGFTGEGAHPANWSADRRGQSVLSTVGDGIKEKDLIGAPWALAIALRADGWWLRDCIIWHKKNPPPTSVQDRTCPAHEYLFLLTKAPRYYYDDIAIEEPIAESSRQRYAQRTLESQSGGFKQEVYESGNTGARSRSRRPAEIIKSLAVSGKETRKKRSVWSIPIEGFDEAHFATFPPELIVPCIKAGSSEHGVCSLCGAPWVRHVERETRPNAPSLRGKYNGVGKHRTISGGVWNDARDRRVLGWVPQCACDGSALVPATVLDPFGGSGTVGLVADRMKRDAILIELKPAYVEMARQRIDGDAPLLGKVAAE